MVHFLNILKIGTIFAFYSSLKYFEIILRDFKTTGSLNISVAMSIDKQT